MYQIPLKTERKNPLRDTQCSNPSCGGLILKDSFKRACVSGNWKRSQSITILGAARRVPPLILSQTRAAIVR